MTLSRLSVQRPGLARPAVLALALAAHVAAVALAVLPVPHLAPDHAAQIDIMLGTDARQTGGPEPTPALAPPPEPTLRAASPSSPPAVPAQPASSPAPPADGTAPPVATARPVPPLAMADPQPTAPPAASPGVAAPPPVMAPPAAPVAPSMAEAPPASQQIPATGSGVTPAGAPDIRIGDGIAAAAAEIEGAGMVHPATSQVGNVPPEYPIEAARRRERGTVVLRIFIAADGSVERVTVLQSSGSAALDRAARERIATWHFDPALRDGQPVPDVEEQSIRFLPE